MDQEISELLEKGPIQKIETTPEEFLSNIFLMGKKDGGKRLVINLKKTQCIHLLRALQNGRFALSETSSRRKRLLVQNRSQRHLLCNSSQQTLIKMCKIQVVRQPLRVSLLCFGLGPAPKVFTKLLKSQLLF